MKRISIALLFLFCGISSFSQVFFPVYPTVYGQHNLRTKNDSVAGIPTKDSLYQNTTDTTAQIFINRKDSSLWVYTRLRGFFKIGSFIAGNTIYTADDILISDRTVGLNGHSLSFTGDLTVNHVMIGAGSGSSGTGYYNTAIGFMTLYHNTGYYNTAIGSTSLYFNTTGTSNTGTGYEVLYNNTTGSYNTVIGDLSLYNNTTGDSNTVVGANSGVGIITGKNNTIIGANVKGLASGLSNRIIISDGAGNQRIYIDNTGKAALKAYGIGTFTGTPTTYPAFDASGNIIETATPYSGGVSGISKLGSPAYCLIRLNDSTYIVDTACVASQIRLHNDSLVLAAAINSKQPIGSYIVTELDPVYIGDSSNHYTKAAANAIFNTKQNTITNLSDTSLYAKKATTITINGVTQDLSANRTWTVAGGGISSLGVASNAQTASYTAVASDSFTIVQMNVASANNLTIPPNSSVAYPIGTWINVEQLGVGMTSIVAGSGVTIHSVSGNLDLRTQYSEASLLKTGTNIWELAGDLNVAAGIFASTNRLTAQTGIASLTTAFGGATDASFLVSANVLVITSTLHSFTATVSYTSEDNTARVVTLNFSTLAGTLTPTIANAGGAVPYEGVPLHIRCKAYTSITVATTGTFTTVVYNIESQLTKLN